MTALQESDATIASITPSADEFADMKSNYRASLAAMVSICSMLDKQNRRINSLEAQLTKLKNRIPQ